MCCTKLSSVVNLDLFWKQVFLLHILLIFQAENRHYNGALCHLFFENYLIGGSTGKANRSFFKQNQM
jgi:hypothetical protein